MIRTNPWQAYILATAISSVFYYIAIGWKFYRTEIKALFSQKPRPNTHRSSPAPLAEQKESEPEEEEITEEETEPFWQDQVLLESTEALSNHLTDEIREAHEKNYSKKDLIQMLQIILKEYYVLKDTPFQQAVNSRIDAECAKYGSMNLSEGEKGEVWIAV